jgi:predicted DNA-binding transcriptional regulator YafY
MTEDLSAVRRIELLLAVLSNLKRYDVVLLADLAQQLQVDPERLAADIALLQYAGLPPFGGGDLVPIELEEGYLCVTGDLPALDRPIRLTGEEAGALVMALQIAGFRADEALVKKLESAFTRDFDAGLWSQVVHIVRARHDARVFTTLAAALDEGAAVAMAYVNNRGERSERLVRPYTLFVERDCWYLTGHDSRSGEVRNFRVENILSAEVAERKAGEGVGAPGGGAESGGAGAPGAECEAGASAGGAGVPGVSATPVSLDLTHAPMCRIRFRPAAVFNAAEWPGAKPRPGGAGSGAKDVDVPYRDTRWIARKVLALHGQAVVCFPDEVRAEVKLLAQARLAELDALTRSD